MKSNRSKSQLNNGKPNGRARDRQLQPTQQSPVLRPIQLNEPNSSPSLNESVNTTNGSIVQQPDRYVEQLDDEYSPPISQSVASVAPCSSTESIYPDSDMHNITDNDDNGQHQDHIVRDHNQHTGTLQASSVSPSLRLQLSSLSPSNATNNNYAYTPLRKQDTGLEGRLDSTLYMPADANQGEHVSKDDKRSNNKDKQVHSVDDRKSSPSTSISTAGNHRKSASLSLPTPAATASTLESQNSVASTNTDTTVAESPLLPPSSSVRDARGFTFYDSSHSHDTHIQQPTQEVEKHPHTHATTVHEQPTNTITVTPSTTPLTTTRSTATITTTPSNNTRGGGRRRSTSVRSVTNNKSDFPTSLLLLPSSQQLIQQQRNTITNTYVPSMTTKSDANTYYGSLDVSSDDDDDNDDDDSRDDMKDDDINNLRQYARFHDTELVDLKDKASYHDNVTTQQHLFQLQQLHQQQEQQRRQRNRKQDLADGVIGGENDHLEYEYDNDEEAEVNREYPDDGISSRIGRTYTNTKQYAQRQLSRLRNYVYGDAPQLHQSERQRLLLHPSQQGIMHQQLTPDQQQQQRQRQPQHMQEQEQRRVQYQQQEQERHRSWWYPRGDMCRHVLLLMAVLLGLVAAYCVLYYLIAGQVVNTTADFLNKKTDVDAALPPFVPPPHTQDNTDNTPFDSGVSDDSMPTVVDESPGYLRDHMYGGSSLNEVRALYPYSNTLGYPIQTYTNRRQRRQSKGKKMKSEGGGGVVGDGMTPAIMKFNTHTYPLMCPAISSSACRAALFGYGLGGKYDNLVVGEDGQTVQAVESQYWSQDEETRSLSNGALVYAKQKDDDANVHVRSSTHNQVPVHTKQQHEPGLPHDLTTSTSTSTSTTPWSYTKHATQSLSVPFFSPLLAQADLFPPYFIWGSASSAFQTEGGVSLGGKSLSIWDVFRYLQIEHDHNIHNKTSTHVDMPAASMYDESKWRGDSDVSANRTIHTSAHTLELNANDQYKLWREDVKLVKHLGVYSHQLDIAWTRVINNDGSVNYNGIKHYNMVRCFMYL